MDIEPCSAIVVARSRVRAVGSRSGATTVLKLCNKNMAGSHRIVVFTGNPAFSVRKGIVEIDAALGDVAWLVVVHSPRKTPRQVLKSQWLNLRRNGWRWIPYQAADLVPRLFPTLPSSPGSKAPGREFSVEALTDMPNLQLIRVDNIHAPASLEAVRAFKPDLGLALAAPILRAPLFSIPRLGTLNLHKGKVPEYRGMPPAFWELWNGEQSVGCTVHWVDEKLDTGDIARQARVERSRFSTLRGLQLQLDEVGVELMRDAVKDTLHGNATSLPQTGQGKTYRKPTLGQFAALERKLLAEQRVPSSFGIQTLKDARSMLARGLWSAGLRRILKPRVTVLLYHRVSDDVRDNLTVGIEQFERQMALLQKHCRVLSIEQLLRDETIPASDRPLVAVTFDDGYLDNFAHASPILLRHGIPAAFFVSTGIVNTDGRFPHDLRRGNPPIPMMTWDQLRKMRDWGFTIGSHTVNHIDCAAEPEQKVRAELADSSEHLRHELGISEPLFGYPYGGRHHMTPQRLELVKQAGYRACLSAYGGSNIGRIDRFNVVRRGIQWQFSDGAFLFECLGLS